MRTSFGNAICAFAVLASSVSYAQIFDKVDLALIDYAAQHRDLSADEIGQIRRITRSCTLLEDEHVSPVVMDALGQVLLHSGKDAAFQQTCFDALYDRIGMDVSAEGYAELVDAVALSHHQNQEFGSFWKFQNGHLEPVGDDFSVDTSRSRAGLPALDQRMHVMSAALSEGQIPLLWEQPLALVPANYPSNPTLRKRLMSMLKSDQEVRSDRWRAEKKEESQDEAMAKVDAENLPQVEAIIGRSGFPDAAQVGRNGVSALFFLVQHTMKLSLMKQALAQAKPLYEKGDLPPVYFALLTDRIQLMQHNAQIYGTQFAVDRKGGFLFPIADFANVNQRRLQMRMAPLKPGVMNMGQRWPIPNPASSESPSSSSAGATPSTAVKK
jgi:hypothetical protein